MPWSFPRKLAFRGMVSFILLFLLSFPTPPHVVPDLAVMMAPFSEALVQFSADQIFNLQCSYAPELISDSTGLYIHAFNLLVIALVVSIVWTFLERKNINYQKLSYWFLVVVSYYLAFQLLTYGFNKIFKWQFYLPDPNTLYTRVGETPRDLLFWSVMGTSYSYNIFAGSMEVLAALLLIYRRTRLLGALISLGVMVNIVMINFGFNISVKFYSSFLMLLSVVIIGPHLNRLVQFFLKEESAEPWRGWRPKWGGKQKRMIYAGLKTLVILILFFDVLAPYFETGSFNSDTAPRPPMHGAYQVHSFQLDGAGAAPGQTWKRVFVHRKGYLIIQTQTDIVESFPLSYAEDLQAWQISSVSGKLMTFQLGRQQDGTIHLAGEYFGSSVELDLETLPWEDLPLLQNEFDWTMDQCGADKGVLW